MNDIGRSSLIMAIGTTFSRLTGLIRNLLLVMALGTAILGDTYQVANTIPTIIYILVAGGALNAVFIPQIVRAMKSDSDGGNAFVSKLVTATITILGGATLITVIAAPIIVRLYASKFSGANLADEFDLTVTFARYCLPQILFLGLFTILGQIANSQGSFGPMMWAPIANNLIVIGVLTLFIQIAPQASIQSLTSTQTALLGVGTSVGAFIQAGLLIPVVMRTGLRLRPNFRWGVLRKSAGLATWTLIFVLINQLGFLVIVNLATAVSVRAKEAGLMEGFGFTPYQNAFLIFLLPHSIIAVSLVTALLPRISRAAAAGDTSAVAGDLSENMALVGVFTIPAAFAFLFLSAPIARLLYLGSSPSSADGIGAVLAGFSLALIPFSASYLLLRGFYAYEDTKTPAIITLVMNIVMSVAAFIAYKVLPIQFITIGIAVAFGVGYLASTMLSAQILRKRTGPLLGVLSLYLRLAVLACIAFLPTLVIRRIIATGNLGLDAFLQLSVAGVIALVLYLGLAKRMKISIVSQAIAPLIAKLRKP